MDYSKQNGHFRIDKINHNRIAILGCGAIGSFTAMSLAKMGFLNFEIYDFDTVEEHNLPNQFFGWRDITHRKLDLTFTNMKDMNRDADINTGTIISNKTTLKSEIVISCVDKMDVRKINK